MRTYGIFTRHFSPVLLLGFLALAQIESGFAQGIPDTDGDGLADSTEVFFFGTDPLAPNKVPFFTRVGDPGNPDDDFGVSDIENTGLGYVGQEFDIGMTEVTNYMYALFLNSVAKRDRLYGLYKQDMADDDEGGIIRRGAQGSYTYEVKPGFEGKPVNFVSLWDTLRYINWLHNWKVRDNQMRDAFRPTLAGAQDQDVFTTEDGAYQLRGTNPDTFIRHPDAKFFLPDVDEWHKAAYYDPDPGGSRPSESYWTAANQTMSSLSATTSPLHVVGTASGGYSGPSHYGTYDQDGNVAEWTQNALVLGGRTATSGSENSFSGFRVARAADEPTVPGWDFVYELKHVNEAAADSYVVSSSNVRKYSEWQSPPVTYWGPSANGVDASITFQFPFERPATRVSLRADLASFNFAGGGGLGSGSCSLWASKDGVNYELLLDNPTPSGIDSYKTFDADLPVSLLGAAELWIQVRFRVEGAPNTSYTDAQFCRSSSAATSPVFAVRADYDGAPPLMVQVSEPYNLADEEYAREFYDQKIGVLNYTFQMGAYEVTNREYEKFLEAKAKNIAVESIYRLYDVRMGSDDTNGGITRKDNGDGTYSYEVKPGMALKPVVYVSIFSAMRYCNWLHNGGGMGSDMEAGAYRLLGNVPTNTSQLTRNAAARYYLPKAEEFYKAAYYDSSTNGNATFNYWKFATRSDVFDANNNSNTLADVDFSSKASYFGTYGQSGNVGYVNPGSGANTPAPKPTAVNTGELLEESANTDDESVTKTFRIAAASGMPSLRPLGDEDSDGLKNGWEALNDLDPRSGAGINGADGDPDGDGLTNAEEQAAKTDPNDEDTDVDGLTDFEELRTLLTDPKDSDSDNDGLTDGAEVNTHGTDPKDTDTDNDGLTDGAEINTYLTDPKDGDSDNDGLGDAAEVNVHTTDPANADTDGDGMPDGWEVQYGLDPKNPSDAALDADNDGLTNLQEFTAGSNPKLTDTDGDGLPDKWEVDNGFNPGGATDGALDTDGDGLTNLQELAAGTDPREPDSDGDGIRDGWEVQNGLNPLSDDASQDADGDGLTNLQEFQLGTNPKNRDTDGDRLNDGEENATLLTDPTLPDTDGDGLTDYQELYVFRSDPLVPGPIPDVPSYVSVGDPGNPDEDIEGKDLENAGIGYVGQTFEIGVSEVTNLMYAKFLDAVAKSDALYGLYSAEMGSSPRGGIRRTGLNGSYVYAVKPGFETRPVNYVSAFDAMRYCNWLHNGMPATGVQNASTTEDGAYKLDGMNRPEMVRRSFGAKYFLPDQDEWHKAAYYDPAGPSGASQDYWFFADRSSVGPGGNFAPERNKLAGTTSDASYYGTFDQDGNIREWLDASLTGSERLVAGGGCEVEPVEDDPDLVLITRNAIESEAVLAEELDLGFRVACAVEPAPSTPDFLPTMVRVGVAGNPADSNGKGRVNYEFKIGAYEVTNEEYADFLNAVAQDDSPYNLYDVRMDSGLLGGIQRTGSPGSYFYEAKDGFARKPVNYVTFYNAMRYCNWLHNGAHPGSDTETGAYRLLGNLPPDTSLVGRNFGARYFLPNENEWYKAAYYDPSAAALATGKYWRFAVRSDNATPAQVAVGGFAGLVEVNRPGIPSYFGSYGQSGNAAEWSETFSGAQRLVLGGGIESNWSDPAAAMSFSADPKQGAVDRGFRIAARADSPAVPVLFPQTIRFSRLPAARTLGTRPLKLSLRVRATSGLPVDLQVSGTEGIATLIGGARPYLLVTGPGTLTVTALQPGGGAWRAATPESQTITILPQSARTRAR